MGRGLLNEILEKRFHEIKNNFQRASMKNKMTFNEDVFMDTYIKCVTQLENKEMNETQIIQYFWVSFVNNTIKEYKKNKNRKDIANIEEAADVLDEPYDDR